MRLKFDIQYVYTKIRTTPSPYIIYINKLFFFFRRYSLLRFALSRHIRTHNTISSSVPPPPQQKKIVNKSKDERESNIICINSGLHYPVDIWLSNVYKPWGHLYLCGVVYSPLCIIIIHVGLNQMDGSSMQFPGYQYSRVHKWNVVQKNRTKEKKRRLGCGGHIIA